MIAFPYMAQPHHQFSPEGCGNPTGVCQQAGRRGLAPIFPVCFLTLIPADKTLCYPKPAQAGAEQQRQTYARIVQKRLGRAAVPLSGSNSGLRGAS